MKDKLSALLDGELDDATVRPVLDSVQRDRALRTDWDLYCMIGDVLRGDRVGSPDLVSRVMSEIGAEPTLLAPSPSAPRQAANGPWRALMPLAASVMGVAAVGWVAHTLYSEPEAGVQVAGGIQPVNIVEPAPAAPAGPVRPVGASVASEDPHREYVFAHQAMTAGGPIPGAVQYVRTVSVAGQDSDR